MWIIKLETIVQAYITLQSCLCALFVVIFGIYASETFPLMSKVIVDRLVLETEGAVSHDLAELFRQVLSLFSLHLFTTTMCLKKHPQHF